MNVRVPKNQATHQPVIWQNQFRWKQQAQPVGSQDSNQWRHRWDRTTNAALDPQIPENRIRGSRSGPGWPKSRIGSIPDRLCTDRWLRWWGERPRRRLVRAMPCRSPDGRCRPSSPAGLKRRAGQTGRWSYKLCLETKKQGLEPMTLMSTGYLKLRCALGFISNSEIFVTIVKNDLAKGLCFLIVLSKLQFTGWQCSFKKMFFAEM